MSPEADAQRRDRRDATRRRTTSPSASGARKGSTRHAETGAGEVLLRLQRTRGNAFVRRLLSDGSAGSTGVLRQGLLGGSELQLDPRIRAQMEAMRRAHDLLDPDAVRRALISVPLDLSPPGGGPFAPPAPGREEPLVPRGRGPATPRVAGSSDVMEAVMGIPRVERTLARLRLLATDRLRRDYSRLSGGGKAALIGTSALIAGGTLAGVISDPDARSFALSQLSGRILPVPGVTGLSVEFNAKGSNLLLGLHLDVGALLPESLGFGPSEPRPLAGGR